MNMSLAVATPDVLTPLEVAKYLRLSKTTVYDLLSRRKLAYVKIGRAVRVLRSEVEKFVSANTVAASSSDT